MQPRQSASGPPIELLEAPLPLANGNSGAAKTIDFSTSPIQKLTLTANCNLAMIGVDLETSVRVLLELKQDGTGNRLVTFNNTVLPTGFALSTAANAVDLLEALWDGTQWWVWIAGKAFA